MSNEINLASVMEGRLATYSMLSRLYRKEMDEETLKNMMAMRCPINTGNSDIDTAYKLFHHYLSHVWERTLEDLARDYMRTFIGANTTGHSAAYPNESVHTSAERMVMQDARDEVCAIYQAAGLKSNDAWQMGEDHISVELEYMQIEVQRSIDALKENDTSKLKAELLLQKNFITDHLKLWVPFLVKDMLKFAQTDFYRALAYLTQGFIDVDLDFLESVLDDEQKIDKKDSEVDSDEGSEKDSEVA